MLIIFNLTKSPNILLSEFHSLEQRPNHEASWDDNVSSMKLLRWPPCSAVNLFSFSVFPHRTPIKSTRASCPSSPRWRPCTPRPRPAATGEARAADGTPRTLEGPNPLARKPCSRAGKERPTTPPSLPSFDSPMAPAGPSRGAARRGRAPQSS